MEEVALTKKIEDLGREITSNFYKQDGKLSSAERAVLIELSNWIQEMVDYAVKKERFEYLKGIWNEEIEL